MIRTKKSVKKSVGYRIGAFLLCLAMMVTVLGFITPAKAASGATVTASVLNLREQPNTGSKIIDRLVKGTRIEVQDKVSSDWYSCTVNGKSGYVHASYIKLDGASEASSGTSSGASGTAVVKASALNFRSAPNTSAGILGVLPKGSQVTLHEKTSSGWYKVTAIGKTGYVHGDYLTLSSGGVSQPAPGSTAPSSAPTLSGLLKQGSSGSQVLALQNALAQAGYFNVSATSYFGSVTYASVKNFQRANGLKVDGIVGPATWNALFGASSGEAPTEPEPSAPVETPDAGQQPPVAPSAIEIINWSEANKLWANGVVAKVTDVRTGQTFQVRRLYGTLHCDVEPLTAADTAVLKACYGGVWSWDRRPIMVEIGGRVLAASMNGMPHGASDQQIFDNNFEGMICFHFVDSRTHGGNAVCPLHQAAIQEAYNTMKAK